jgi:hypothetical protein
MVKNEVKEMRKIFQKFFLNSARSLNIDLGLYKGNMRYVFKPPEPIGKKKYANGFHYINWSNA